MKNKFKFKIGQVVIIKRNQSNEFWKIIKRPKSHSGKTVYKCRSLSYHNYKPSMGDTWNFYEQEMHIPFC